MLISIFQEMNHLIYENLSYYSKVNWNSKTTKRENACCLIVNLNPKSIIGSWKNRHKLV